MLVTTIKIITLCMFGDTNPNILASLANQKRFFKSLTIGHYLEVCY